MIQFTFLFDRNWKQKKYEVSRSRKPLQFIFRSFTIN